jgi:hypothetical protein
VASEECLVLPEIVFVPNKESKNQKWNSKNQTPSFAAETTSIFIFHKRINKCRYFGCQFSLSTNCRNSGEKIQTILLF